MKGFGVRGSGFGILAAVLLAGALAACGSSSQQGRTTTPEGSGGTGTAAGSGGTTGGTGTGTSGTGGATTPTGPTASPLEAGIDEALARGGAAAPAGVQLIPLSSTETANFEAGVEAFELRGDDAAARSAFQAVLASNPTAYRAAYNLGYLAERLGDTREAILNYQRALDVKPDYPNALRALFRLLDRLGRSAEGLAQVQSRGQAFPDNAEIQQILAEAYIAAGRPDEGVLIARRLLTADAESLPAFLILLKASIQQGREALTNELLLRITNNLESRQQITFDACAGGGPPEYRVQCKLWSYIRFTQARTAAEEGRPFEAQQYYQNAIDADPTFVEARVLVAGYQLDRGQLDEAIANLEAAQRMAPTWLPVLVGLGNAYRGKADYARAVRVLREAERLYPASPEVPIGIGLVYYDARNASFENLDRAQSDQAALDAFRRAQGLIGAEGTNDTELVALIDAAQRDYDIATTPIAPIETPTGWGEEGGGEEGGGWGGGEEGGGWGGGEEGGGWGGGETGGGETGGGETGGGETGGGETGGGEEGGGGGEWGGGGW